MIGSQLSALGCWLLLAASSSVRAAEPLPGTDAYAGSPACRGCHAFQFERWRETRHARSILTAMQARQAGYPLPQQRPDGPEMEVDSWQDVGMQAVSLAPLAGAQGELAGMLTIRAALDERGEGRTDELAGSGREL